MSSAAPYLEAIYIAGSAGSEMAGVSEVEAIVGNGLRGDRYAEGTGYYSRADPCQVTLIAGEDLDRMHSQFGVEVHHGQHRRNLVLRGIPLAELVGRKFAFGEVLLEFDRPRPPCAYVQRLTQPGMTRALGEGAGIAARILTGGMLRVGSPLVILPGRAARRRLP